MSEQEITITFEIEDDEAGGYVASSNVGSHSLVTGADTLDDLKNMVEDLLRLFVENSGQRVACYIFHFSDVTVPAQTDSIAASS